MADTSQSRAIFSTKLGRLNYKPARPNARCIIRSEYWDDVYDMAKQLQSEFPDHCNSMTQREVQTLENYFDPLDIQMHSRPFLVHVLELIVCWNLLASIHEVNEFAENWIVANPEAYERLNFNAAVTDVFHEYDIQNKRRDLLESALNQLVKWKYPEGWALLVEDYHAKRTISGNNNSYLQTSWATANPQFQEQFQDIPVPRRAASDPVGDVSKMSKPNLSHVKSGPVTAGPYPSISQYSAPSDQAKPPVGFAPVTTVTRGQFKPEVPYGAPFNLPNTIVPAPIQLQPPPMGQHAMSHPIQPLAQMPYGKPLAAPNELLEQIHPGSTSRGDFHSDPVTASWQEKEGYSRHVYAVPSRGRPGPFQLQRVPLSARQRGFRAAGLPKGVRNPPKRISDDIRNQTNGHSFSRRPSEPDQIKWVPIQQANFPPEIIQPPSGMPQVPSRTNSIGPGAPFMPAYNLPFRQLSSSMDNHCYDQGVRQTTEVLLPNLDPNSHQGRFEDMRLRQVYDPMRIVSNPFPTTTPPALPYPEPDLSRVSQTFEMPPLTDPSLRMPPNPEFRPYVQQLNPDTFERSVYRSNTSTLPNRPVRGREQDMIMHQPQFSNEYIPKHGSAGQFKQGQPCDTVLYVAGFPPFYSRADVRGLLRPCRGLADVSEPRLSRNESGPNVSFVFATFESVELAAEALHLLPNTRFRELDGNTLLVSPRFNREYLDYRKSPKMHGDHRKPTTWKSAQDHSTQKTGSLPITATEQRSERNTVHMDRQQSMTGTSKHAEPVPQNQPKAKTFQGLPKQEGNVSAVAAKESTTLGIHREADRVNDLKNVKRKVQDYGGIKFSKSSQPLSPKVFDRVAGKSVQATSVPKPRQDQPENVSPERVDGPASTSTGSPIRKKKNHNKGKDFRNPRLRQVPKSDNQAEFPSSTEKSSLEHVDRPAKQEGGAKSPTAGHIDTPLTPPSQSNADHIVELGYKSANPNEDPPPIEANKSVPISIHEQHHSRGNSNPMTSLISQEVRAASDTRADEIATMDNPGFEAKTGSKINETQLSTNDLPAPAISSTVPLNATAAFEFKKGANERQQPNQEEVSRKDDKATSGQPGTAPQTQAESKEPAVKSRTSLATKDTSKVAVPLLRKTKKLTAVFDGATPGNSSGGLGTINNPQTASTTSSCRPPKEYAGNVAVANSDLRNQEQKSKAKPAEKSDPTGIDIKGIQNKLEMSTSRRVTPTSPKKASEPYSDNVLVAHAQDASSSKGHGKQDAAKPQATAAAASERSYDADSPRSTLTKNPTGQATVAASQGLTTEKNSLSARQNVSSRNADESKEGKESSAKGAEQTEGPSIPPRSSSISHPPTPEPIITRKKKQKSFATIAEDKPDRSISENLNSKLTEEKSQEKCISALPPESKSEKSNENGEAQQAVENQLLKGPSTEGIAVAKKKSKNNKSKKSKSSRNVSVGLEQAPQSEPQRILPEPETPYLLDKPSVWQAWKNSRMNPKSKVPSSAASSDTPMDDDVGTLDWYYHEKNKHLKELHKGMRTTSVDDFYTPREYENAIYIHRQAKIKTREQLQEEFTEAFREAGYAKPSSSQRFKSDDPQLARIDRLFEERDKSRCEELPTEEKQPPRLIVPYVKNGKDATFVADGPQQLIFALRAKKMIEDAQAMRRLETERTKMSEMHLPTYGNGLKASAGLEEEVDKVAAEQTFASIHDRNYGPGCSSPFRKERIEKCQQLLNHSPRRNTGKSKTLPPEQWDRKAAALLAKIPRLSSEEITKMNYLIYQPAIVRQSLVTDLGITPADIMSHQDKSHDVFQGEEAPSEYSKPAAMGKSQDQEPGDRTKDLSTEDDDELPAASRLKEEVESRLNSEDCVLSGAFAAQVDEVSAALAAQQITEVPSPGSRPSAKYMHDVCKVSADKVKKQTSEVYLQDQETEVSPKPVSSTSKRDLFSSMMGKPSKEQNDETGSGSTDSTEHFSQQHSWTDTQTTSDSANVLESSDLPNKAESAKSGISENLMGIDEAKTHEPNEMESLEDAKHSKRSLDSISSTNDQEIFGASVRGGGTELALISLHGSSSTDQLVRNSVSRSRRNFHTDSQMESERGEAPLDTSKTFFEKVSRMAVSNAIESYCESKASAINGSEGAELGDRNDAAYRSPSPHSFPPAVWATPSTVNLGAPSFSSILASAGKQASNSSSHTTSPSESTRGNFEAKKGGFRGGPRGKAHAHSKSDPWALSGEEGQWGGERGRNGGEAFANAMTRGERRASGSGVNSSPSRVRRGGPRTSFEG